MARRSMKSGYHIVYKATSPSGKVYIGYTHYFLKERVKLHFMEAKRGTKRPFCNAINKYGKSIKWEIIATYQTEKYALNREKYFIKLYNTYNSPVGYNCTTGGQGNPGAVLLTKRIAVIDNNGIIYTGAVEIAEKLKIEYSSVKNAIKNNYWCNGYYFSHYKEGMSKAIPPKTTPKRCRKIINNTTGEVFDTIRDAVKVYGISEQSIGRVCRGLRSHVRGNRFAYLGERTCRD